MESRGEISTHSFSGQDAAKSFEKTRLGLLYQRFSGSRLRSEDLRHQVPEAKKETGKVAATSFVFGYFGTSQSFLLAVAVFEEFRNADETHTPTKFPPVIVCLSVKRDLIHSQKRPNIVWGTRTSSSPLSPSLEPL